MSEVNLGRVGTVSKGNWSAQNAPYSRLDTVYHNLCTWCSLINNNSSEPSAQNQSWLLYARSGASIYDMMVASGAFTGTEVEFVQDYQSKIQAAQNAATNANTKAGQANAAAISANDAASSANGAASSANSAAENANNKASLAETKATLANNAATLANTKADLADTKAGQADAAATAANNAASSANGSASSANSAAENANNKASLAETKATLANNAATLANEKANLANTKAGLANDAAALANEKANAAYLAAQDANTNAALANTAKENANNAATNANNAATAANNAAAAANAIQSNLENGTLIPALAEDLNIPNTASLIHRQSSYIETAGGSDSIKSGSARVLSVKGTQSGITSANAKIVARGFNQLGSSMIAGHVATIPCVASEWGAYGSSAKNNGYLFTNNAGNIVVPTSVTQNGVAVPTHTYGGVVYYLPSNNGKMVATFAAGVTMANLCCHICWSNYRDRDYAAYAESVIDISSLISTMGGTLRRIDMGSLFTFDEIVMSDVASERKYYKRVDVATLSSLTWAMTSTESEGSTTYHFTAPISAMLENGIYQIVGSGVSGIYVEGNTVKFDSTTITSVADLQTALGSMLIKYQKATVTSGTHNLTGAITVDDFGTIILAGGSTSADMDIEFITYWRDTLKNLPSRIDTNELVIADVLNDINSRLSAIEDKLSNGIDHLKVDNLDVVRTLRGSLLADADSDYAFVICRAKAPDIAPKFIGQRWVNTTNGTKYTAKGVSASTDYVQD